jgi:predicted ATPase with chaperone activity
MTDPIERIRQKLIDRIAQIVDHHHATGVDGGSGVACSCGAQGISKHSRHVAGQIVDQLDLKPEIDEVKKRIRYASAIFDWELTKIEGAQC